MKIKICYQEQADGTWDVLALDEADDGLLACLPGLPDETTAIMVCKRIMEDSENSDGTQTKSWH